MKKLLFLGLTLILATSVNAQAGNKKNRSQGYAVESSPSRPAPTLFSRVKSGRSRNNGGGNFITAAPSRQTRRQVSGGGGRSSSYQRGQSRKRSRVIYY